MPVEFSVGAFRLPHSRTANGYFLQAEGGFTNLFPEDFEDDESLFGGEQLQAGEMIEWRCKLEGIFQKHKKDDVLLVLPPHKSTSPISCNSGCNKHYPRLLR